MAGKTECLTAERYFEALAIADRMVCRQDELLVVASDAALEAARKWDGRGQFRAFVRRVVRWRIQDYWRAHDPLTRTERAWKRRECSACGRPSEQDMICPNCGHNSATDLTPQEEAVWKALASGEERAFSCGLLGMRQKMFEFHIGNLRRKLGIKGGNGAAKLTRLWMEREAKVK